MAWESQRLLGVNLEKKNLVGMTLRKLVTRSFSCPLKSPTFCHLKDFLMYMDHLLVKLIGRAEKVKEQHEESTFFIIISQVKQGLYTANIRMLQNHLLRWKQKNITVCDIYKLLLITIINNSNILFSWGKTSVFIKNQKPVKGNKKIITSNWT